MLNSSHDKKVYQHHNGVMLPFMAVGFVIILVMLMFTVDVAYMQMVRTELRVATDIAAKAGVEALRRTQDPAQAKLAVLDYTGKNQVAGNPLQIGDEDVTLGKSTRQTDNSWKFEPGVTPFNAIKVETALGGKSLNPPVNLFFGKFWGAKNFTPTDSAVASNTEVEIVLCIDRSHSMCFDLTGVDWKYPPTTPKFLPFIWPPKPGSRWEALDQAVTVFTDACTNQSPKPRISLVTWGSQIDNSSYEGWLTGLFFPPTEIDESLTENHPAVNVDIDFRGARTMLGGTEMSSGIEKAIEELKKPTVKPLASRVIVLMTDGKWTHGYDPIEAAKLAYDEGIVIHTVGFLDSANSDGTLKAIADTTGGRYLEASDKTELLAAFKELSQMLPVALTE